MPFNVRGRAWLFIIKSGFLLFKKKSLPFLEKPLKNACVMKQMDAILTLSLWMGGGHCAPHSILKLEMREAAPFPILTHPSQQRDHSQVNRIILLENV